MQNPVDAGANHVELSGHRSDAPHEVSTLVGSGVAHDAIATGPHFVGLLNSRFQPELRGVGGHMTRPFVFARSDASERLNREGLEGMRQWADHAGTRVTCIELREQSDVHGLGPLQELVDEGIVRVIERAVEVGDRKYGDKRNAAYPGIHNGQMYGHMQVMLDEKVGAAVFAATHFANLPNKINCASGKDRTQIVSGLALALLEVSDRHIIADYEATNPNNAELLALHAGTLRSAAADLHASGRTQEAEEKLTEADWRQSNEALEQTAATGTELKTYITMMSVATQPSRPGEDWIDAMVRTRTELEANLASDEHVPSMLAASARIAIERRIGTHFPKRTPAQVAELADRHIERLREYVLYGYVSPKLEARRQAKHAWLAEQSDNGLVAKADSVADEAADTTY